MLPSTENLLRHVEKHPGRKTRDLAAGVEVADDEFDNFVALLLRLQLEGSLVRVPRSGWHLPAETEYRVGKLSLDRRGHGYVRAAAGTIAEEDVFVQPDDLGGAFAGDVVLVRLGRGPGRSGKRLREGRVCDIIQRGRRLLRGKFRPEADGGRVAFDDGPDDLEAHLDKDDAAGLASGEGVLVRILDGLQQGGRPRAKVIVRSSEEGTFASDLRAIREIFDLPGEHPEGALKEAKEAEAMRDGARWPDRQDLRGELIFTIDPLDAKDFDDAVSIERLPGGKFRVGVHIADVSHYVRPGSRLDAEAAARGTSIYLPGHVIPMLPERLANDLASLRPAEDRLTKTARMTFDAGGGLVEADVFRSVIRSRRRFTYEEVLASLEVLGGGKPAAGVPADHELFADALRAMAELRDLLHARRYQRGALYLDIPKLRLQLDRDGNVAGLGRDERDPSHSLIEELMLAANEAVAQYFVARKLPLIARVHPPPERKKVGDFVKFLKALGLRSSVGTSSRDLQKLIEKLAGDPLSPVIQLALLRTMGHAEYVLGPGLHFALATESYCHFTSPIRRYPDLLVHQVLDQHFDGVLSAGQRSELERHLAPAAEQASDLERRAEEAEREMTRLRLIRYLQPLVGEKMEGRIVSIHPFGFFVRVDETLVEGLVHVSVLNDDFYEFDEEKLTLQGRRSRGKFALGDRVRVELWDVNPDEREISFRLVRVEGGRSGTKPERGGSGKSLEPVVTRRRRVGRKPSGR